MNLQTIKSIDGKAEYVLLPITVYKSLRQPIEEELARISDRDDYVLFDPADYVDNPVALARYKAGMTQEELAKRLGVSQAYISKVERQEEVSPKVMTKISKALSSHKERSRAR